MRYGRQERGGAVHIIDERTGDALCGVGPPIRRKGRRELRAWYVARSHNPHSEQICERCAAARRGERVDDFD